MVIGRELQQRCYSYYCHGTRMRTLQIHFDPVYSMSVFMSSITINFLWPIGCIKLRHFRIEFSDSYDYYILLHTDYYSSRLALDNTALLPPLYE